MAAVASLFTPSIYIDCRPINSSLNCKPFHVLNLQSVIFGESRRGFVEFNCRRRVPRPLPSVIVGELYTSFTRRVDFSSRKCSAFKNFSSSLENQENNVVASDQEEIDLISLQDADQLSLPSEVSSDEIQKPPSASIWDDASISTSKKNLESSGLGNGWSDKGALAVNSSNKGRHLGTESSPVYSYERYKPRELGVGLKWSWKDLRGPRHTRRVKMDQLHAWEEYFQINASDSNGLAFRARKGNEVGSNRAAQGIYINFSDTDNGRSPVDTESEEIKCVRVETEAAEERSHGQDRGYLRDRAKKPLYRPRGVSLTKTLSRRVATTVVKLISAWRAGEGVAKPLEAWGGGPNSLLDVIRELRRLDEGPVAQEVFAWSRRQHWQPTLVQYNTVIAMAARAGDLDRAEELFNDMQGDLLEPDSYTWAAMVDALARKGRFEEALKIVCKCQQEADPHLDSIFKVLLDAAIDAAPMSFTQGMIDVLQEGGLVLDAESYYILMRGLLHKRMYPLVEAAFVLMLDMGITPTPVCHKLRLEALLATDGPAALAIAVNIVRDPPVPLPLDPLEGTVFRLVKEERIDAALELLMSLEARGDSLGLHIHGSVMAACLRVGRTGDARSVLQALCKAGRRVNTYMYAILIAALAKERKFQEAMEALREMKARGHHPDIITYTALIDASKSEANSVEVAKSLFDDMRALGRGLDEMAYSSLLQVYARNGLVAPAKALLNLMQRENVPPGELSYRVLAYSFAKQGLFDDALEMTEELSRFPNVLASQFTLLQCLVTLAVSLSRTQDLDGLFADLEASAPRVHARLRGLMTSCLNKKSRRRGARDLGVHKDMLDRQWKKQIERQEQQAAVNSQAGTSGHNIVESEAEEEDVVDAGVESKQNGHGGAYSESEADEEQKGHVGPEDFQKNLTRLPGPLAAPGGVNGHLPVVNGYSSFREGSCSLGFDPITNTEFLPESQKSVDSSTDAVAASDERRGGSTSERELQESVAVEGTATGQEGSSLNGDVQPSEGGASAGLHGLWHLVEAEPHPRLQANGSPSHSFDGADIGEFRHVAAPSTSTEYGVPMAHSNRYGLGVSLSMAQGSARIKPNGPPETSVGSSKGLTHPSASTIGKGVAEATRTGKRGMHSSSSTLKKHWLRIGGEVADELLAEGFDSDSDHDAAGCSTTNKHQQDPSDAGLGKQGEEGPEGEASAEWKAGDGMTLGLLEVVQSMAHRKSGGWVSDDEVASDIDRILQKSEHQSEEALKGTLKGKVTSEADLLLQDGVVREQSSWQSGFGGLQLRRPGRQSLGSVPVHPGNMEERSPWEGNELELLTASDLTSWATSGSNMVEVFKPGMTGGQVSIRGRSRKKGGGRLGQERGDSSGVYEDVKKVVPDMNKAGEELEKEDAIAAGPDLARLEELRVAEVGEAQQLVEMAADILEAAGLDVSHSEGAQAVDTLPVVRSELAALEDSRVPSSEGLAEEGASEEGCREQLSQVARVQDDRNSTLARGHEQEEEEGEVQAELIVEVQRDLEGVEKEASGDRHGQSELSSALVSNHTPASPGLGEELSVTEDECHQQADTEEADKLSSPATGLSVDEHVSNVAQEEGEETSESLLVQAGLSGSELTPTILSVPDGGIGFSALPSASLKVSAPLSSAKNASSVQQPGGEAPVLSAAPIRAGRRKAFVESRGAATSEDRMQSSQLLHQNESPPLLPATETSTGAGQMIESTSSRQAGDDRWHEGSPSQEFEPLRNEFWRSLEMVTAASSGCGQPQNDSTLAAEKLMQNSVFLEQVFHLASVAGEVQEMASMARALIAAGFAPSKMITRNLVLHCTGRGLPFATPAAVLQEIVDSNLIPRCEAIGSMAQICCEEPWVIERSRFATSLVRLLRQEGQEPSPEMCTLLVSSLWNAGHLKDASELAAEMGTDEWLNASYAYSALIGHHAAAGQLIEAWEVALDMRGVGLQPSSAAYSKLVQAAALRVSDDDGDDLATVLEEVEEDGVQLDQGAYEAAMEGLVQSGKVLKAVTFFRRMRGALGDEVVPAREVVEALLLSLRKKRLWRPALDIFHSLRGSRLLHDSEGYSLVIGVLMRCNRPQETVQLYQDMVALQLEADVRALQLVKTACMKLGLEQEAKEVGRVISWSNTGLRRAPSAFSSASARIK